MTKKDFMEQIASRLGGFYSPKDYSIHCEIITKNNDSRRYGIIINKKGDAMSPTIYVDDFYRDYLAKKITLDEASEQIDGIIQNLELQAEKYRTFSVDYESCRDKIVFRLVSRKRNETMLKGVPYLPFLDLAILFYVVCDMSDRGLESLRISQELMERWQTNVGQLMKLAAENTPRLFPARLESMGHVLTEYLGLPDAGVESEELIPMTILTNTQGVNGASALLYENVIADLAGRYDSDLYILPSSIHEVLVLPDRGIETREELSRIVQDVNGSHVREDEILSEHAYFYDRKERRFKY